MSVPIQVSMFIRMIYRYLPMAREGRIYITEKELLRVDLNPDEVEFCLRLLFKEGICTDYHRHQVPDKEWGDPVDDDCCHAFFVDKEKLDQFSLGTINDTGEATSEFIAEESVLKLGGVTVNIPPYKNEYDLCRVMFKYPKNKLVDWSEIYDEMIGGREIEESAKAKRRIYDMLRSVNNRVKEATSGRIERVFIWQEKTVRRIF